MLDESIEPGSSPPDLKQSWAGGFRYCLFSDRQTGCVQPNDGLVKVLDFGLAKLAEQTELQVYRGHLERLVDPFQYTQKAVSPWPGWRGKILGVKSHKLDLFLAFLAGIVALSMWNLIGEKQRVLDSFHQVVFDSQVWYSNTKWLGIAISKNPADLWTYQELITETRPDVLIEAGTSLGGSALYFASLFDLLGHGRVVTIDIHDTPNRPPHPRITYLIGSSTSDAIAQAVRSLVRRGEKVMVSLDSDHRKPHVLNELRLYSGLVSPGCYLVVEDTDINGHPVAASFGPGPFEAVGEFMRDNHNFVQDRSRDRKFGITFFPGGWLKRVR
jgi:cephalosporin hydroxylase